ncbi:NLP/P60 protein [Flammeovirgaceae bacterium 311]|nr:NLP/P60 protein [Flammeovirgaceae bacterium 311]
MNLQQQRIIQFFKHIAGQKFTWFAFLMVCLTVMAFSTRPDEAPAAQEDFIVSSSSATADNALTPEDYPEKDLPQIERIALADEPAANVSFDIIAEKTTPGKRKFKASKMITYAHTLLGTPYIYGGTSTKGFDCSGYVYHVFSKFGLELNRSSSTQSEQGVSVPVEEVVPGDVLFFTGTNPSIRDIGHVGIVISEPGEPVSFIHSSSNGGVKISELEGYYDTRFMFAKRMN